MENVPYDPDRYEPTPEDQAEYSEWLDSLEGRHRDDFCPADFGHYCADCDLEMAGFTEPEQPDQWYLDLVARADFRHDQWRD